MKYLILIRTIALLHQHQRPVKRGAGRRGCPFLHRGDEGRTSRSRTASATRSSGARWTSCRRRRAGCSAWWKAWYRTAARGKASCGRISALRGARCARRHSGANTQLKVHLGRLLEMEYLAVHRGKQGQGYVYELAYDGGGKDGSPFVTGLLDGGEAPATTGTSRGVEGDLAGGRSAGGRAVVGGRSGRPNERKTIEKAA